MAKHEVELPPGVAIQADGLGKRYRTRGRFRLGLWQERRLGQPTGVDLDDDDDDDLDDDDDDAFDEPSAPVPTRSEALTDLTFEVRAGQVMALLGTAGAGKSTLLHIVGRTTPPTGGQLIVAQPVAPPPGALARIVERTYTARQNLAYLQEVLGADELTARLDDILAFAGLTGYAEERLGHWPPAGIPRFLVSLVLHMDARVILSEGSPIAGEPEWRERCLSRLGELTSSGAAVLITCSDAQTVRQLCTHAIWLDEGALRMVGEAEPVATAFEAAAGQGDEASGKKPDPDVDRHARRLEAKIARTEQRRARKTAQREKAS